MDRFPSASRFTRGRLLVVVGVAAAAMPLTACGTTNNFTTGLTDVSLSSSAASTPKSTATLTFTPALGDTAVVPGSGLKVVADKGRITSVKVVNATGNPVKGALSTDNRSWVANDQLTGYGSKYVVAVTAVDREGITTTTREQVRTLVPEHTSGIAGVDPSPNTTFGAGIPITVTFDDPVENKAAVEKHLVVLTSKPVVGAWRWLSDTQAQFRPKTYWPGKIHIVVKAQLVGVQMSPGVWGDRNHTYAFTTYDSIVGLVNMRKHTLVVRQNGKVIRTIPITTGKPGFETRSGVKVVMTKERNRIMDAATGGTDPTSPEYYRLNVEYAMRLTWSGEFLHAAPWSEGSQGYDNVSHGCTGMSTDNAAWLYGISHLGDVYEYVGNDKQMGTGDNGITVWNVKWADWLKDSKAGEVTTSWVSGSSQ